MKTPRHLISFSTSKLPSIYTDVLVIGSGIAGLRAAIEASRYGQVLIITKDLLAESNTFYAQGGIASHITNPHLAYSHINDTIKNGQGINDPKIVRKIIANGIINIKELIEWGIKFDMHGGKYHMAHEGGHQYPRILHAGGDHTGEEVVKSLINKINKTERIDYKEQVFTIDILTDAHNVCRGVLAYQSRGNNFIIIQARKTILATGGLGQLYRETTNPNVATGDGIAMAYRAGAVLQDMEFIQFHPTALYIAGAARTLISEAVRGAGGILVNKHKKRFMPDYHPQAELAPRDVVSRSIINQMRLTNDTSVYLDVTHLGEKKIKNRFPGLYRLCKKFRIDITHDLIPVRPSAHYMLGGIRTKPDGSTNIDSLFAAGECASCNFHGANRLGSNSLLESLVMGAVCGKTAGKKIQTKPFGLLKIKHKTAYAESDSLDMDDIRNSLKSLMTRAAGMEREEKLLNDSLTKIDFWDSYVLNKEFKEVSAWELQNMLILARLIAQAALKRTESRGTHYRIDFPAQDNKHWKKHITIQN
jgi:L-aspartate oxidase